MLLRSIIEVIRLIKLLNYYVLRVVVFVNNVLVGSINRMCEHVDKLPSGSYYDNIIKLNNSIHIEEFDI